MVSDFVGNIQDAALGDPITVAPSDNVFDELGNNNYDYKDLLSELVDNSLAAREDGQQVNVRITLYDSSEDPATNRLVVWDDASGIPKESLGSAISPAALQTSGSLNEHGLGMKQAIAGLGKLESLTTKTASNRFAVSIREFKFGEIYPHEFEARDWAHGTEIVIRDLNRVVATRPNIYTRDIVPYLGARYRKYLAPGNPIANILIQIVDVDDGNTAAYAKAIEPVAPIYYHPNTHKNSPVIDHEEFNGDGWSATLVFGYAPETEYEWDELGLDSVSRFHPYHSSLSKQGLDVILNNRVIMFHQLPELRFVGTRHNDYNAVRGEIILGHGFKTAITKNNIIRTEHWEEMLNEVKYFLENGNYIKSRTYPTALPEAALRDRLTVWLKDNALAPRQSVAKEYAVEALGGKIDILADGEAWELKREDAYGLDVYQLFGYLDMGGWQTGYLVAKSFRESAYRAQEHINKNHNVDIQLVPLEQFPINHNLSQEEIAKYT